MFIKIAKKIKSILRTVVIKIIYKSKFKINTSYYKIELKSMKNLNILDGNIIVDKKLTMALGAKLGVDKGGVIKIGSCFINNNSNIVAQGQILIGDDVSIGPNVCIYDHDHAFNEFGKINHEFTTGKIKIGNNVWIGAGSIILKNTTIGDNTIIGAGSIVKGDIPSNSLVTSNRDLKIEKLYSHR